MSENQLGKHTHIAEVINHKNAPFCRSVQICTRLWKTHPFLRFCFHWCPHIWSMWPPRVAGSSKYGIHTTVLAHFRLEALCNWHLLTCPDSPGPVMARLGNWRTHMVGMSQYCKMGLMKQLDVDLSPPGSAIHCHRVNCKWPVIACKLWPSFKWLASNLQEIWIIFWSEFWSSLNFWSSNKQTESDAYEPTMHMHRCAQTCEQEMNAKKCDPRWARIRSYYTAYLFWKVNGLHI